MIWHKRIWGRKRGEGEILIKTVFVGLLTFAFISVGLIMIGNVLEVKWLMFSFYKETSTGFELGVRPFHLLSHSFAAILSGITMKIRNMAIEPSCVEKGSCYLSYGKIEWGVPS